MGTLCGQFKALFSFLFLFSFLLSAEETSIPQDLSLLPLADVLGIIKKTTHVSIRDVNFPFHPSLVEHPRNDGYLLFFREDLPGITNDMAIGSRIGMAALSKKLKQVEKSVFFNNFVGEDPTAFWKNDELYLLYNIRCPSSGVRLAKMKTSPYSIEKVYALKDCEMNWMAVVHPTNSVTIPFIRALYPLNIAKVNLANGALDFSSRKAPKGAPLLWTYGDIQGGTQAEWVGSCYLGFFYSAFQGKSGKLIYVMGAYTLDSSYQLSSISSYPILSTDMYGLKAQGAVGPIFSRMASNFIEASIIPSGFVLEDLKKDNALIHVSCGENENSIRIITFDKNKLLESLVSVQ